MRAQVFPRIVILSLVLLLWGTWSGAATIDNSLEAFGLVVFTSGIMAPDFATIDLQENPVALEDYRGKVILLVFWASW